MAGKTLTMDEVLDVLRQAKPDLCARHGVTRIGVFGSVAREDAITGSDVDVVVEMAPDLYARIALRADLEQLFQRPVDVVRYRQGMNPDLRNRIDEEAVYV